MSSSSGKSNGTVWLDDFESLVQYSNNADFSTPDPSNATDVSSAKASGYYAGTYHKTSVPGASFSFNFTGTSVNVFGGQGGEFGSYSVTVDGNTTTFNPDAKTTIACSSCSIFALENLSAGPVHTVTVKNGNASLLFDWAQWTTDFGAQGSSVHNTTVEETDSSLKYVGTWGNNKSPLFSGGGSTYTNAADASVTLEFNGSAIYAWGDTNANHGQYTVTLDTEPPVLMKSVTGCGLDYQVKGVCEQTIPGLLFFRSYLSNTTHTITLTNVPGPNSTYFDLDRFTYSIPNSYFTSSSSGNGSSNPFTVTVSGSSTLTIPTSPTGTQSTTSASHTPGAATRLASPFSLTSDSGLGSLFLIGVLFWTAILFRSHRR